jgi:hypothetical protein
MRSVVILLFAFIPLQSAEPDALAISANIQAKHLPYGTILDPIYAAKDSDQIVNYTRCGDSAIWTGHYLAAESYRYAVTKSPEALTAVRNAIQGINMLLNVTGNNLLARCFVPAGSQYAGPISQEEKHNGIYTATYNGDQYLWVGNTSRDQYAGVFYGLTVAHDVVDDNGVQGSVRYLVARMLDYLRGHGWFVIMPDGSVSTTFIGSGQHQLSFLKIGRRMDGHYTTAYKALSISLAPETIAPIALDVKDPYDSYFKFNLDTISFYGLLASGDSSWVRLNYEKAYDILRNTVDDHQNAFFNMIDRAINGPNATRDEQTRQLLDAWLQRPRRDDWVDLRSDVPTCDDATRACDPIPVERRVRTDFLWQRSPFQLYGGGDDLIETAGIDYILPYWMGRYYGVITD